MRNVEIFAWATCSSLPLLGLLRLLGVAGGKKDDERVFSLSPSLTNSPFPFPALGSTVDGMGELTDLRCSLSHGT